MNIQINEIKENTCELYDPNGKLIGVIFSALSYNDVRLQIKRQKLERYYVIFNGEKITLFPNGRASNWPEGFFDIWDKQLDELLD